MPQDFDQAIPKHERIEQQQTSEEHLDDDLDNFDLAPWSSGNDGRPGKRSPALGPKKKAKWKLKSKYSPGHSAEGGSCFLLGLPNDVLVALLIRLPPRSLLVLSRTCRVLNEQLKNEAVWRGSYLNRYLWEGAASVDWVKEEVRVLAQGCTNEGQRGWKKESVSREAMLDRWNLSKSSMVIHQPTSGLIQSLSLSYPPFIPMPPNGAPIRPGGGRPHQTPSTANTSTQPPAEMSLEDPESSYKAKKHQKTSTHQKVTHRQQYEALLAATTRPTPYILSAIWPQCGVVRSDPISGKVSKGFWGPGNDANLNLQPVWHWVPPSANFLPRRKQTFTLSGRSDGSCVHTTILSRHRTPHGGRASSLNVQCDPSDAHEGEVCNIWAPESSDESLRWVTAGADGKVKLWRLHPAEVAKPSRIIPDVEAVAGSISCLFTSTIVEYPFPNRSDLIKRRQAEAPDPVILARCDVRHGVLCGVTKDGDLRVWFGVDTPNRREVRLDCNAAESFNSGGVKRMELEVRRSSIGLVASILVHHDRSASFARFDVTDRGHGESSINVKVYTSSDSAPITTLQAHLQPTAPISMPSHPSSALPEHVTPIEAATEGLASPSVLLRPTGALLPATSDFGRLIVAGHQDGAIRVWSWDGLAVEGAGKLLRVWTAASGKITAVDFSCGLLAIGSFDGYIRIFDPLSDPPTLLRNFHASRLSPGDALIASTDEADAQYFTVNQIILDNDLIVASIGRKVFGWRAGTGKGRQDGKGGEKRQASGGKGELRGNGRTIDRKSLHQDASDSHHDIREHNAATRVPSQQERQHLEAMEYLGLEDGDDAVQYALMLSMEEHGRSSTYGEDVEFVNATDDEVEALRAVEVAKRAEEEEMREVLEMSQLHVKGRS